MQLCDPPPPLPSQIPFFSLERPTPLSRFQRIGNAKDSFAIQLASVSAIISLGRPFLSAVQMGLAPIAAPVRRMEYSILQLPLLLKDTDIAALCHHLPFLAMVYTFSLLKIIIYLLVLKVCPHQHLLVDP